MGERGRSQASACCNELLSEARPKTGEDRSPSEHGAVGWAPAYSLSVFLVTQHTAAPLVLAQLHQLSCVPSCPRTFAQAVPQA